MQEKEKEGSRSKGIHYKEIALPASKKQEKSVRSKRRPRIWYFGICTKKKGCRIKTNVLDYQLFVKKHLGMITWDSDVAELQG